MKKFLIGCGVIVLVLAILAGWAFWQFVWKPGSAVMGEGLKSVTETVKGVRGVGETMTRLREIEQGIRNQSEYAPPADGRIDPDQLARWLTVENVAREAIAADLKRLEEEARAQVTAPEGSAEAKAQQTRVALAALGRLGEVAIRGKQAQVAALNAAEMSLAEYRWVRDTGIAALIAGGVSVGLDQLGQSAEQAEQARRALAEAGKALESLGPELRAVLERMPGLLPPPSGPAGTPAERSGADAPGRDAGDSAPPAAPDPEREAATRANFELVKDHAEAFAGARMLAILGI
jgi:hypothetical protein